MIGHKDVGNVVAVEISDNDLPGVLHGWQVALKDVGCG